MGSEGKSPSGTKSRFAEFRKVFWTLDSIVCGLKESSPRVGRSDLAELNALYVGGFEDDPDEVVRYAAAWQAVASQLQIPLSHPSMFGIVASSVHELIVKLSEAITQGFFFVVGDKFVLPPLDNYWLELIAHNSSFIAQAAAVARTCKPWDAEYLAYLLTVEAGWIAANSKSSNTLTADTVLTSLQRLKTDFSSPQFSGFRYALCYSETGELLMPILGTAIDNPNPGGARVNGLVNTEESIATVGELYRLFEQAGQIINQVPNFGVVSAEWKERIEREPTGQFRWAAFLSTGPRRIHFHEHSPNSGWIDDVARVSAMAVQDLISVHLASCERPSAPFNRGNDAQIVAPTQKSPGLSAVDLHKELGVTVKQVNRWADKLKIQKASVGTKNHRFTVMETVKILNYAATRASNRDSKAKAAQILTARYGATVTHLDTK